LAALVDCGMLLHLTKHDGKDGRLRPLSFCHQTQKKLSRERHQTDTCLFNFLWQTVQRIKL